MTALKAAVAALVAAVALTGCGSAETFQGGGEASVGSDGAALVVGSQDYYSNEILAEAYAQALEAAGYVVDRQLRIGQREVYLPDLRSGRIDVFPEYTGNLLQYLDPQATAKTPDEVQQALTQAMPNGLRALQASPASDQDAYAVTKDFAEQHSLKSIGDLASVDNLTLGGNSELESRPYGPPGLRETYGVDVKFTPIEDSGGGLAVKALRDGQVQLIDLYTANPVLAEGDLVVLEDPKSLFLASNVVPIVSGKVDEKAVAVLDAVSAAMSPEELRQLNQRSATDKAPAATIARGWLASEGLV